MILKRLGIIVAGAILAVNTLASVSVGATAITPKMNGKILYSMSIGVSKIFVMDSDGSNKIQLTSNTNSNSRASWSPNGKKITFQSSRDGNSQIYIMNSDGTNQTRITNNVDSDEQPKWSPDGTKIAFLSNRDGNYELYTMNIDGTNQTRITNNSGVDRFPNWSPDGTKIVFSGDSTGREQIYVYNLSNSATTQITNLGSSDQTEPNWSPDGSKIIMASSQGSSALRLYKMDPDGSNQTLINFTCPNTSVTFNIWVGYPTYSPDGKKILTGSNCYTESQTNNSGFVMLNADGSSPADFSNNPSAGWYDTEWMELPVSSSVDDNDGNTTNTVDDNDDDSDYDYEVGEDGKPNKVIFVVNGKVGQVNVNSNGVLKGHGTIVMGVTVKPGGKLAPGNSPGCINSGGLTLTSGSTYEVEIAGTTVCTQYDQTNVTGTVDLGGATLNTLLLNSFTGSQGNTFTIVNNDGADAVTGTFSGLAEGASITVGGTVFRISYVGGDGNDVVLTITNNPPAVGVPNTGMKLLTSNTALTLAATVISAAGLLVIAKRYNSV